jgi:hypothetical protein
MCVKFLQTSQRHTCSQHLISPLTKFWKWGIYIVKPFFVTPKANKLFVVWYSIIDNQMGKSAKAKVLETSRKKRCDIVDAWENDKNLWYDSWICYKQCP